MKIDETKMCTCSCHKLAKFGWFKHEIKMHTCCPKIIQILEYDKNDKNKN